jgi:asparagine synthetase B (glutamine-hydrolysing)
MLLRVASEPTAGEPVPAEWADRLISDGRNWLVSGDDTGETVLSLSVSRGRVTLADDLGELIDARRADGDPVELSPAGVSYFLHDGQTPFPASIYRDVYRLSIGDRATIERNGRAARADFSVDFPYFSERSREDQVPDPDRLLSLLAESTSRRLAGLDGGVLLLSAGKDSTALALALAEAGVAGVVSATYTSRGDDEHVYARDVARRLGLPHRTISLEAHGARVRAALERFFESTPAPAGDLAQIPVIVLLEALGRPGGAVIEGTGNDATFGYVPRQVDRIATRLTLGRFSWADALKRLLPPGARLNYFLRDPAELNWAGLRVRHCDTRALFPDAVNTSREWRSVRRSLGPLSPVDFRGYLRGRHFEVGSQKDKIEMAARAFGMRGVYPYQDAGVIDYYFNLPEVERYDRARGVNKLLLRRLLRERLGYDERAVGKRAFQFDGAGFVSRHRAFIEDEILGCGLFDARAHFRLRRWIDAATGRGHAWQPVVGLFQFAGWYNRSRHLRGPAVS